MEKVKDEIEGAVRSGPMTRKQAVAEYERIKRTLKRKGEVTRELHREIEEERGIYDREREMCRHHEWREHR